MAVFNFERKHLALSIFAVLSVAQPAFAQQAPTTDDSKPADQKKAVTLAGMVVTAQKREQAVQDVPITMTVASKQLLQDAGVRDIKALQILVPAMSVISTGNEANTAIRMRGVGTTGDNPGLESSVGVVIDGVPRSRTAVGFDDLGDLERIEVLYGPQGTLFGQNTSSGVVNVVTQQPSFKPKAETELTVGNYGEVGASAYYTGPISDKAAFSIYATQRSRDGFYDVNTGEGPRSAADQYISIARRDVGWAWPPSGEQDRGLLAAAGRRRRDFTKNGIRNCRLVSSGRIATCYGVLRPKGDRGRLRLCELHSGIHRVGSEMAEAI